MQEIPSAFRSWLTRLKAPPGWSVFLGICLFTIYYVLNPLADSFIAIQENELHLEVPVFRRIEMKFTEPVRIQNCILGRPEVYTHVTTASSKTGSEVSVDGEAARNFLTLENCYTNEAGPIQQMVQSITISVAPGDRVQIASASVDDRPIALKTFLERNIKNHAYITKTRYFRQTFARSLSSLNDFVSNWILTFMFFGISWVVVRVLTLEVQAYLYPRSYLISHIQKISGEKDLSTRAARERARERCADVWSRRDSMYKYLQALGPATGFIITVTSLIYSLSSSKVDVQLLLGGMHIAMVSTFLGLFLRIVALEAERVSVRLLSREAAELAREGEE